MPGFSLARAFKSRLARNACLLTLAGVTSLVAGTADAAREPVSFKLSIRGTAHAEWDHTGAPVPSGDCMRTIRSEGIRDVRFRTAKPTVVRVVDGRVLAATVRRLAGTVTLAGANTVTDICGAENRQAIQDCATTKRAFKTGILSAVGRRAGSLTFGRIRNTRLSTSNCPREPAEVVSRPLGPVPGPLRISTSALANTRIARITLSASASQTVTYGPEAAGTLKHRSAWKVTLQRVRVP